MFDRLDMAQEDLKKHRAQMLTNLQGGIGEDLLRKIKSGELTPPLDADVVAKEIFTAMNSQPFWDMALEAVHITVSDVKAVLQKVCVHNDIILR